MSLNPVVYYLKSSHSSLGENRRAHNAYQSVMHLSIEALEIRPSFLNLDNYWECLDILEVYMGQKRCLGCLGNTECLSEIEFWVGEEDLY